MTLKILVICELLLIIACARPQSTSQPIESTLSTPSQCVYKRADTGAPFPNPSLTDANNVLPDPNCTPGTLNALVTQDNIDSTICSRGKDASGKTWIESQRPPVNYTSTLKRQQMTQYGATMNVSDYEEDHLISLELGGSPTDKTNLWPEPEGSPNPKDTVENKLHSLVCGRVLSLADAQNKIKSNWTKAVP